jgi:lysophospholipase L1-like esterase
VRGTALRGIIWCGIYSDLQGYGPKWVKFGFKRNGELVVIDWGTSLAIDELMNEAQVPIPEIDESQPVEPAHLGEHPDHPEHRPARYTATGRILFPQAGGIDEGDGQAVELARGFVTRTLGYGADGGYFFLPTKGRGGYQTRGKSLVTVSPREHQGHEFIAYHFDYHGGPRSYQWLNTNPLPKIWDQMSMAKAHGADRVWIVNVGHFKGYELPLEYFMSLAWDTAAWGADDSGRFTRLWAEREFGAAHAADIADIVALQGKYNGRRKPELLAPSTFSLINYLEAETVCGEWSALAARAEAIAADLPPAKRDAFYQLVLFPAKAGKLINGIYLSAARNDLFARQGRASANAWAAAAQTVFKKYLELVAHYHGTLAGGKWDHFMDQPILGYTSWRDPAANSLDHLKFAEVKSSVSAALGVAVEGAEAAWPGGAGEPVLPRFDAFARRRHYVDIFNRGQTSFAFTATASAPWIVLSATQGTVGEDQRLWVDIDWSKAPAELASGTVQVAGAGATVTVKVEAFNPAAITRETLQGFVESEGHVSIEPEHFTRATEAGTNRWFKVGDYGRTLSGMKAWGPLDAPSATPGKDSPCLEYRMHLFTAGEAEVTAITAPTLNFIPDRGVRYAVSFDDEAPQVVTLVPAGWKAVREGQKDWEKSVADNAHHGRSKHRILAPGYHTLKVWMVDAAVVVQKLIVDLGGLKPSYLGPPESFRGPMAAPARPAADQPVMRSDPNSQLGHQQLLEKARAGGISVYFFGDSITRRWGATDYPDFLAHWKKNFHGWNAGDFGWGGDTTQNMIWRLTHGELDGVNPKVIVLLAGTNNIGKEPGDEAKVADVTRGVTAVLNLCRAKAPGATIILTGIFPRNDGPVVPTINRINANLAKLADGQSIRFLNINDRLADAQGRLFEGMTVDQLHPSLKGYEVWAEALKPVLTELLGPPAATDTAPPPTGDPSAKR